MMGTKIRNFAPLPDLLPRSPRSEGQLLPPPVERVTVTI